MPIFSRLLKVILSVVALGASHASAQTSKEAFGYKQTDQIRMGFSTYSASATSLSDGSVIALTSPGPEYRGTKIQITKLKDGTVAPLAKFELKPITKVQDSTYAGSKLIIDRSDKIYVLSNFQLYRNDGSSIGSEMQITALRADGKILYTKRIFGSKDFDLITNFYIYEITNNRFAIAYDCLKVKNFDGGKRYLNDVYLMIVTKDGDIINEVQVSSAKDHQPIWPLQVTGDSMLSGGSLFVDRSGGFKIFWTHGTLDGSQLASASYDASGQMKGDRTYKDHPRLNEFSETSFIFSFKASEREIYTVYIRRLYPSREMVYEIFLVNSDNESRSIGQIPAPEGVFSAFYTQVTDSKIAIGYSTLNDNCFLQTLDLRTLRYSKAVPVNGKSLMSNCLDSKPYILSNGELANILLIRKDDRRKAYVQLFRSMN